MSVVKKKNIVYKPTCPLVPKCPVVPLGKLADATRNTEAKKSIAL